MNTIKIPAVDYRKVDELQNVIKSLGMVTNMYRFTLNDPNNHIQSLLDEYEKQLDDAVNETEHRLKAWTPLLFKFYKMTQVEIRENYEIQTVSYIYPYLVINSNSTLWMLEVKEGDNYYGGVLDHNYTVDENWNCDIYLEEITTEEFMEVAKKASEYVIERRLNKLSENA